ncbi:MAG: hypothetical protein KGN77_05150 [Xanthomonadaceae bacterium]|nr:hypothetical protein [Xanthomonadaceae bacterium]
MNEDVRQLGRDLRNHRRLMQRVESLARQAPIYPGFSAQQPSTSYVVQQTAHGFTVGQVIRCTGLSTYALAQADTFAHAQIDGVVGVVLSVNAFVIFTGGVITGLSGLTAGSRYYLSKTVAGATTTTAPTSLAVVVMDALSTSAALINLSPPLVQVDRYGWSETLITVLTSGTSYTIPTSTYRYFRARMVAAGGAGGADAASTACGAYAVNSTGGGWGSLQFYSGASGGAGQAGEGWEIDFDAIGLHAITGITYAIGVAGGAKDTTLTIDTTTVTAKGGNDGTAATIGVGNVATPGVGGFGASGSMTPDVYAHIIAQRKFPGQPGQSGGPNIGIGRLSVWGISMSAAIGGSPSMLDNNLLGKGYGSPGNASTAQSGAIALYGLLPLSN